MILLISLRSLSLFFTLSRLTFSKVFRVQTSMKLTLHNFEILSQFQRKRQNNRKRSDKHFAGAVKKINTYAI